MNSRPACVKESVPLAPLTTLKVGGIAEYVSEVTTVNELRAVIAWAKASHVPWRVLGGGSNVLVSDNGLAGLIILPLITERSVEEEEGDQLLVTYGAGLVFDDCVKDAVEHNWWGLENLSHIPGTVGATPIQNVGAYGVEVADIIESVSVYDTEADEVHTLTARECQFAYRSSRFKTVDAGRFIILDVTFRLSKAPRPILSYKDLAVLAHASNVTPMKIRETVISIRSGKFPDWNVVGTAGSFFKNPIIDNVHADTLRKAFPDMPMYDAGAGKTKVSLGFILDKVCGLRGYAVGPVRLYEQQALVLVAEAGATAAMIDSFATEVARLVFEKTNIHIEREVVVWP